MWRVRVLNRWWREREGGKVVGTLGTMGGWSLGQPWLPWILMRTLTFLSGAIYLSFSFLSSD